MEHYPKSCVEASAWCAKCRRNTPHLVNPPKLGACKVCLANLEAEAATRKKEPQRPPAAVQERLF